MASAAASRPPAPPPPPPPQALQWLGPRVSFSLDDAGGGGGGGAGREAAGGKPGASADFEFLLAGCSTVSMLPADELFSGGKLVPLRIPPPPASAATASASAEEGPGGAAAGAEAMPKLAQGQARQMETPRAEEEKAVKGVAAAEEPKIPARRWRDLLRLRKQQASAQMATSEPRPLRRFLRRGPKPPEPEPSLSLPLLRESGPDEADKPEKTSPAPAPAPVPTPASPPPSQHQNLPPKIRLSPSQAVAAPPVPPPPPPPPPAVVAADSPRLNAAGKVVFNGLGRSSSSPSTLAGGRRNRAGGAIERSYSAHVRVAPVLNVPVCSLRGSRKSVSVFGIDRFFSPSSATSSTSASAAGKKVKAAKK